MLAECIVAVGTMLTPLAIVLLTTIDDFPRAWAYFLMVAGTIALIVGLIVVIRNEIREGKQEKRRRRIDKSSFIMLAHMAEQLGVDIEKVVNTMESKLDDDSDDQL